MDKKILLILGGSSDIGQTLIRRIHSNYEKIIVHYNKNSEAAIHLAEELGGEIVPFCADLNIAADVSRLRNYLLEEENQPCHVVNMVSPKFIYTRADKDDPSAFRNMMESSLFAFTEILRPVLRQMSKRHYGKIIIMLSSCTREMPPKYISAYVTAKYALLGLMRSLAADYSDKGICVNGVSPDMTETKFLSEIPNAAIRMTAEKSVMGRLLGVDEVVPAFEFLLSDAADKITGQNIFVTGVK